MYQYTQTIVFNGCYTGGAKFDVNSCFMYLYAIMVHGCGFLGYESVWLQASLPRLFYVSYGFSAAGFISNFQVNNTVHYAHTSQYMRFAPTLKYVRM
jgi:hypothetical protein